MLLPAMLPLLLLLFGAAGRVALLLRALSFEPLAWDGRERNEVARLASISFFLACRRDGATKQPFLTVSSTITRRYFSETTGRVVLWLRFFGYACHVVTTLVRTS